MPKLKSNRSAIKRFRSAGKGRFKFRQASRSHLLTKKTSKRKRHLGTTAFVHETDQRRIEALLPYGPSR